MGFSCGCLMRLQTSSEFNLVDAWCVHVVHTTIDSFKAHQVHHQVFMSLYFFFFAREIEFAPHSEYIFGSALNLISRLLRTATFVWCIAPMTPVVPWGKCNCQLDTGWSYGPHTFPGVVCPGKPLWTCAFIILIKFRVCVENPEVLCVHLDKSKK